MAAGFFTSLAIALDRARRHEFWPPWLFYAPLIPYTCLLALRARSATAFTACNPAIENAGGWVGERKSRIMQSLGETPFALRTLLIPPNPDAPARAATALELANTNSIPLPFILKPDAGERGYSVRLARSEDDVRRYFAAVDAPVVLQPYHPGPHECGVLWVRYTTPARATRNHAPPARNGFIFSVTRKEFPVIEGDGTRTLEQLILAHPRYRLQHAVFLDRWKSDAHRVLAAGERLRLAMSGNHCQGTLFRDGADLITEELSATIDAICSSYNASAGLDFCRIDIRYQSDELLKKGQAFAIVELNGTSAESTNLYDPSRSPLWAYRILFAQWKHLYALGRDRMNAGARPITFAAFLSMVRAHRATRTASHLAD